MRNIIINSLLWNIMYMGDIILSQRAQNLLHKVYYSWTDINYIKRNNIS